MENLKFTGFRESLCAAERSAATAEKYLRDVRAFYLWLDEREVSRDAVLEYKAHIAACYAVGSVNSMLCSLNAYFKFCGRGELCVKTLKIQRSIFAQKDRELTRAEYERLLRAARNNNNERLFYLMQTICATGIRVSELKYVTAEAVRRGAAEISCKGKRRTVLLPWKLCTLLKKYMKKHKIISGSVFITRNGAPVDRSNIWSDMKKLCAAADVQPGKVFPHNLRHLFARTYYSMQKDIVRLADILGHASIDTTRIYTVESGEVHRRQIERLGLLLC